MKNNNVFFILILLAALVLFTGCENKSSELDSQNQLSQAEVSQNEDDEYIVDRDDVLPLRRTLKNIEPGDLSEEEKEGLILMREEEKLAYDVYMALYEKWGKKIFSNIARSEQMHTDTIKFLLYQYGIEDPVIGNQKGVYQSKELRELYTNLVDRGLSSLEEAFFVGIIVEDLDIKDLLNLLEKTDNEDIIVVYQNLMKGSRNHMRAFERQLQKEGMTYEPQYISTELYVEIISGDQERGSVNAMGEISSDEMDDIEHRSPNSRGRYESF